MVKRKINVLLVEDDLDIAEGIFDYLQAFEIEVDFAYSLAQAQSRIEQTHIDLIILDVHLPDGSGFDFCRDIKQEKDVTVPIIFLTARAELEDKLLGFDLGAIDYMVKPFALPELKARVIAALNKQRPTESLVVKQGQWSLDINKSVFSDRQVDMQLYDTGCVIMRLLMESYPKVVNKSWLYNQIWSDDVPASDPLRSHIHQLRQQFKATFQQALIETVRGVGYRLKLEVEEIKDKQDLAFRQNANKESTK